MDDVKDVMARRRFVTSRSGMRQVISWDSFPEEDCSTAAQKQVILVDYNEKNQAVDGVEKTGLGNHRPSPSEQY